MMPETCWGSVDNKHLIVASCWFSLSLHNLLTMHGHRNLKPAMYINVCRYIPVNYFMAFLTQWWTLDVQNVPRNACRAAGSYSLAYFEREREREREKFCQRACQSKALRNYVILFSIRFNVTCVLKWFVAWKDILWGHSVYKLFHGKCARLEDVIMVVICSNNAPSSYPPPPTPPIYQSLSRYDQC